MTYLRANNFAILIVFGRRSSYLHIPPKKVHFIENTRHILPFIPPNFYAKIAM